MFERKYEPLWLTNIGVPFAQIQEAIGLCGRGKWVEATFMPTTHYLAHLGESEWLKHVTGIGPDVVDERAVRWVEFVCASCLSVDVLAQQRDDIIIGTSLVAGRLFYAMLLSGGQVSDKAYAHLVKEVVQFLCSEFRIESESRYLRFVLGGCIAWFHGFIPNTTELGRQFIAALLLFNIF